MAATSLNLTEKEGAAVLRHLVDNTDRPGGIDLTQYGLMNAITRTAQDAETYDRATELEKIGGSVIGMDSTLWDRISGAERDGQGGAINRRRKSRKLLAAANS